MVLIYCKKYLLIKKIAVPILFTLIFTQINIQKLDLICNNGNEKKNV